MSTPSNTNKIFGIIFDKYLIDSYVTRFIFQFFYLFNVAVKTLIIKNLIIKIICKYIYILLEHSIFQINSIKSYHTITIKMIWNFFINVFAFQYDIITSGYIF